MICFIILLQLCPPPIFAQVKLQAQAQVEVRPRVRAQAQAMARDLAQQLPRQNWWKHGPPSLREPRPRASSS